MINPNTPNQIAAEYEAKLAAMRQQLAEAQRENADKALEIDRLEHELAKAKKDAEKREQSPKVEMAWECNECGSQEYTMSVSEDDVHELGCGNCGGDEWHKAVAKY